MVHAWERWETGACWVLGRAGVVRNYLAWSTKAPQKRNDTHCAWSLLTSTSTGPVCKHKRRHQVMESRVIFYYN